MANFNSLTKILALSLVLYSASLFGAARRCGSDSSNIIHKLHLRSLGSSHLRLDHFALLNKNMHQLCSAIRTHSYCDIAVTSQTIKALITEYQAPFVAAIIRANEALDLLAAPNGAVPLAAARHLLTNPLTPKNFLALCLAWHLKFPEAPNLDETLDLNSIIHIYHTKSFGTVGLESASMVANFESIQKQENSESLMQQIIDFVLILPETTDLHVTNTGNCKYPLRFTSPYLTELIIDDGSAFPSLDLHTPALRLLSVCNNPKLRELTLNLPALTYLAAYRNTALVQLNLNTKELRTLYIFNNPAISQLTLDLPFLNCISAHTAPKLTELTLHTPLLPMDQQATIRTMVTQNIAKIAAEAAGDDVETVAGNAADESCQIQ